MVAGSGDTAELGLVLRHLRIEAGLTLEELASQSGLSVRTLSDLERGRTRRPYPSSVRALVKTLGLPASVGEELITRFRTGGTHAAENAVGDDPMFPHPPEASGVVPRQLPAGVADFAGRVGELKLLDELAATAEQGGVAGVLAVNGMAGVGKTAMAVHWAHHVASRFPDGQLYLNLRGFDPSGSPMSPASVIRYFLDALDVPAARIPVSPEAQEAMYRSLMAGRKLLLLLDNARDEQQVRPLLPGTAACLTVVTSRVQLSGLAATHSARLLSLKPLTRYDSQQLLSIRLGADRVEAEPGAADRLIELCGGLPLALAITAARFAAADGTMLAAVADELTGARSRLDALDAGEALADARTVFSWSFQGLSPAAAGTFLLVAGLHSGPDVSTAAGASLAGMLPDQIYQALRELIRACLLTEPAPGRYSCHDLLRSYADEQAGDLVGQREQHAARQRMFDHYLFTASAAALLMYPNLKPAAVGEPGSGVRPEPLADAHQARAWFHSEHRVLLSVIEAAAESGFGGHAWRIAWAFRTYLEWRGFWRDEVSCLRTALEAAQSVQDEAGQASIHWALDLAYARLGRYDDARHHNQQARVLYRRLDDPTAEANTHMSSAWAAEREGRCDDALADALQALDLFRVAGHPSGEAAALNNAAWFHAMLADYPEARDYGERAIKLTQRLDNRFIEANAWHTLGYIQHLTGAHGPAIACYRNALELMSKLGNRQNTSEVLDRLGDAFQATGDIVAARESWEQAVAILDGQHHPGAQVIQAKLARL